jgi:hypothetical protein
MTGRQVHAVLLHVFRWIRSGIFERLEIDTSNGGDNTSFGFLRWGHGNGDV